MIEKLANRGNSRITRISDCSEVDLRKIERTRFGHRPAGYSFRGDLLDANRGLLGRAGLVRLLERFLSG